MSTNSGEGQHLPLAPRLRSGQASHKWVLCASRVAGPGTDPPYDYPVTYVPVRTPTRHCVLGGVPMLRGRRGRLPPTSLTWIPGQARNDGRTGSPFACSGSPASRTRRGDRPVGIQPQEQNKGAGQRASSLKNKTRGQVSEFPTSIKKRGQVVWTCPLQRTRHMRVYFMSIIFFVSV